MAVSIVIIVVAMFDGTKGCQQKSLSDTGKAFLTFNSRLRR